jgi:hypothetical protein
VTAFRKNVGLTVGALSASLGEEGCDEVVSKEGLFDMLEVKDAVLFKSERLRPRV